MTVSIPTSFVTPRKPVASVFTHTAVSRGFIALIVALRAHVEAERDLEHAGSWDLACDAWLRDAEAARAAVLVSVAAVSTLPADRLEDRVLRHVAGLIGALVDCDNPQAFSHFRARTAACAQRFTRDTGPLARRLSLMMDVLLDVIAAMAALPDYADMIDAAPVDPVMDATDPEDPGPFELPTDILDPLFAREMSVISPTVGPLRPRRRAPVSVPPTSIMLRSDPTTSVRVNAANPGRGRRRAIDVPPPEAAPSLMRRMPRPSLGRNKSPAPPHPDPDDPRS